MDIIGTVYDSKQQTVPFAAIYISDADGKITTQGRGVSADAEGAYSIAASQGEYVSADATGYKSQTVKIGTGDFLNFSLEVDSMLPVATIVGQKVKKYWWAWLLGAAVIGAGVYFIFFHKPAAK